MSKWEGLLGSFLSVIGTLSLVTCAHADAATHEFRITKATTYQADCGGGSCIDACQIYTSLTAMLDHPSGEILVSFRFENPNVDYSDLEPPYSTLEFLFSPLTGKGETVETTDHEMRLNCSELSVEKIVVECIDPCAFTYVSIGEYPEFGVESQKVAAP